MAIKIYWIQCSKAKIVYTRVAVINNMLWKQCHNASYVWLGSTSHIKMDIIINNTAAVLTFLVCIALIVGKIEACSCSTCCGWSAFGYCSQKCYDGWNGWGGYSGCSRSCGGGTQTRYRSCPCGGTGSQTIFCNTHCLNGGTYSGGCVCPPWHEGTCCQGI